MYARLLSRVPPPFGTGLLHGAGVWSVVTSVPIRADADYFDEVLGAGGLLARHLDGYVVRPGQVDLARSVDAAVVDGGHLIAEGPTGTGKSVAYLVPAVRRAVGEERRVLVATANIALQEQLARKDLPFLAGVLPWPFSHALLKGRSNYLCLDCLEEVSLRGAITRDRGEDAQHAAIVEWAG